MTDFVKNIINNVNLLDIFFFIIFLYNIVQCFVKGFSLSIIS